MDEFQISSKVNYGTFECSKTCEKPRSSPIPGKNYRFCGASSKEISAVISDMNHKELGLHESLPGSNGSFHLDWLHILCIVVISNLAIVFAAFLYFKLRNKTEHFTLHSTQFYEMAQIEPEEEIQIVTKDQINFGETKKLLGRGAFGKVYKCTFTDPEGRAIHAAVKIIDPIYRDADIETERRRIFDEFRNMMIPRHPYVIHLLGINMADDLMLIMPLRKECLKKYLACSKNPIPINRLSRFCSQIADGMMHLHSHNVFHCDLKAGNVLIKDEFHIEICDFGLACPSIDDKGRYRGGTFSHMAIELLTPLKTKVFTQECDIWSYGITVWEIYNLGKLMPYEKEGRTAIALYDFLDNGGRLKKPDLLKADLWPNILQCFAKNPKVRP
uniref:Protein kinase domain-containing protein n=1 Tax=Panagrolaimus sp. ES5 TaxID=591445 RepID=A0AC34GXF3_9BILA